MVGNQKLPIVYVDDSRGCPRRCPFCGHRVFSGDTRREQAPERVVAHMQAWHEELGTQTERVTVGDGEAKEVSFTFSAK